LNPHLVFLAYTQTVRLGDQLLYMHWFRQVCGTWPSGKVHGIIRPAEPRREWVGIGSIYKEQQKVFLEISDLQP
jgi:hypothetical protein